MQPSCFPNLNLKKTNSFLNKKIICKNQGFLMDNITSNSNFYGTYYAIRLSKAIKPLIIQNQKIINYIRESLFYNMSLDSLNFSACLKR